MFLSFLNSILCIGINNILLCNNNILCYSITIGEESCQAKATVRKVFTPPVFTQPLSDTQYLPNTEAKLPARVAGNPKPDIAWFKDGKKITPNDKYREKRENEGKTYSYN